MRYGDGPWDRSQRNRAHRPKPPHVNRVTSEEARPLFTAWDGDAPKPGVYGSEGAACAALRMDDRTLDAIRSRKAMWSNGNERECVITLADLADHAGAP